ncbi:cardiolipin synthase [Ectobacillus panaciterrae]|uniref:cardiolipin synthase n=1 Tax=Ectobacillus panaciterrae TaxID=363872 RepID=UPI0003F58D25|nr:cardiolipin synthase [Ectobacillus panaciterrae]
MLKRRIEFLFVLVMIVAAYFVFFTHVAFYLKAAFISFYIAIILISVYSLMLENRTAQHTLLWIYVLVFFPILGYIFYLYSGQLSLKGYLFKSKRVNDRELLRTIEARDYEPDFSSLNDHQRCFAQYCDRAALTMMNNATQTNVLKNGAETFEAIKKCLKEAQHFIHMEYYIFRSDRLGKEIIDILMEKAKEGVAVRFLYDAMGSLTFANSDVEKMKKAGIQVHPFLPIKLGFFNQKFNFRNHRKIIIIDGKIGFVGGLNVGVEYLGEDEKIGFWRDTHLALEGAAVQTLHAVFLLDWEYVCSECLLQEDSYIQPASAKEDGLVHVVATGPDTPDMSDFYYTMISCATKSIWIASPYFVPNESIRTALRVAARKGIQVRIMLPEINDGFLTQYATRSYIPELLRCGIEIYFYKKGFMHQKVLIVDGDVASIGTANMDMRSFQLNFEVNVFLIGCSSVQDLVTHYEEDIKDSERVSPVQFYKRSMLERSKESFARLFSGVL